MFKSIIQMSFALTKFIFPLKELISLSRDLNYQLDNPRTEEEINLVKKFITPTIVEDTEKESLVLPIIGRTALSLGDLKKYLEINQPRSYALEYYLKSNSKNTIEILAETWIIVRFTNAPEFAEILANQDKLFEYVLSKRETELRRQFNQLLNYSYLLSLLCNDKSRYYGESFLLSSNAYELFIPSRNREVRDALEEFIGSSFMLTVSRKANWLYWSDGNKRLIAEADRLESLLVQPATIVKHKKVSVSQKQSPKQKLMHIGGLLKTSREHLKDLELMLLLLVSAIEYLLTRNPDNNRFNVEDSISKQFKLKAGVLIHYWDIKYNLAELSQQLDTIYSQRSDLAHGNFRGDINMDEIMQSVLLLYQYNRCLINVFIDDRIIVEFLKDN